MEMLSMYNFQRLKTENFFMNILWSTLVRLMFFKYLWRGRVQKYILDTHGSRENVPGTVCELYYF